MRFFSPALRTSALLWMILLVACGTPQIPPATLAAPPSAPQLAPLAVRHVVFFKLKDKSDLTQLERSCDEKLSAIPGVVEFSLGRPIDTGRASVDCDYDLAVYVGFPSLEAYRGYLVHPQHVALVSAWKDKFQSLRIFDFGADHE